MRNLARWVSVVNLTGSAVGYGGIVAAKSPDLGQVCMPGPGLMSHQCEWRPPGWVSWLNRVRRCLDLFGPAVIGSAVKDSSRPRCFRIRTVRPGRADASTPSGSSMLAMTFIRAACSLPPHFSHFSIRRRPRQYRRHALVAVPIRRRPRLSIATGLA